MRIIRKNSFCDFAHAEVDRDQANGKWVKMSVGLVITTDSEQKIYISIVHTQT